MRQMRPIFNLDMHYALVEIHAMIRTNGDDLKADLKNRFGDLRFNLNEEWDTMEATWPALGALGLLRN